MLRTVLLSLVLLISLTSSTSIIRRKLSRRQADSPYCHAIDGFDCKCSFYRVTCTIDRAFNLPLTISDAEKHKYQTVELVISAAQNIQVDDQSFAPVKELYKEDADNVEFRLKFEGYTDLRISSPGFLNRVFPDSLPSNARKHVALQIYNSEVPPHDDPHLFQNLQADSLELYALYPFHGTFQQMFDGANIKFLHLSGGDIRSDPSQSFTGNIQRLELAKQADKLSVQNFPAYPAHEMIINAYYISEFNNEHPPNYDNLGELRVHTREEIPAHAFRQYPNIHTLSVTSEKGINPHAFDGLDRLEKLVIKDKVGTDVVDNLPNVKEFEGDIGKLDSNVQCKLLEKLANGQVAVQAIPNGNECTCTSAYLDAAAGRMPCSAQDCEHSSCAAIKNNYDAATGQFTPPPPIQRADGSDALRPRATRVYTAPFQISSQDQEKLRSGIPTTPAPKPDEDDQQQPDRDGTGQRDPNEPQDPYDQYPPDVGIVGYKETTTDYNSHQAYPWYESHDNNDESPPKNSEFDYGNAPDETTTTTEIYDSFVNDQRGESDSSTASNGDEGQGDGGDTSGIEGGSQNGTDASAPGKRKMNWLPIIIIIAAIVALLLIGLLFLLLHRRRSNPSYNRAATSEQKQDTGARA
ncbi:unnamed protein product [Adineta ricciae]|uniref:Uncharacterized protein n=1 Tax=Adineta ricciae TaxID=249248 RepID=A0A815P7Y0_ADIRI|nr:unnamed protein product [Adineta ricciae]